MTTTRRADYKPELRKKARDAVKKHGTYRAAAAALGLSPKRVWELTRQYDERN